MSDIGSVASVVEEGHRGAARAIHCRGDTTVDERAGGVAQDEGVRRVGMRTGEGEGDAPAVDTTDVTRTGEAGERVEGREDRPSVQIGRASWRARVTGAAAAAGG